MEIERMGKEEEEWRILQIIRKVRNGRKKDV